ncbi:MAG: hypothetical protein IJ849_07020 [Selenomonadaceae bacterium]|nr:hypothetical protein [Selenomonadaceae bacterium]
MVKYRKLTWLPTILGVICWVMLWATSSGEAANIKDYPRVAVMQFGNKAVMSQGLRDQDFSAASEYAIYQLSASGWFDLIDYEQLSTIAKMHSINMSGMVDPATAVAMGKFAGAQFMVIGNLTGLTTKENVVGYQHGRRGELNVNEHVVTANVAMRIVDIETGRIVVAGLGKGSSTSTYNEVVFKRYRNKKTRNTQINDSANIGNNAGTVDNGNIDTIDMIDTTDSLNTGATDTTYNSGEVVDLGTLDSGDTTGGTVINDTVEFPAGDGEDMYVGDETYGETYNDTYDETYAEGDVPDQTGEDGLGGDSTTYSTSTTINTDTGTFSRQATTTVTEEEEEEDYKIKIGTVEVSDIQVRNAISKAVRDGIYGKMGLLTTLNGGKELKIKTGF